MVSVRLPAKKAILGALLVALGGLVVGYFLIPGDDVAVQMQQMAVTQEVGSAGAMPPVNLPELKAAYDSEQAAGGATFSTVQAYAQGLQKTNDIEGAVQLWRAYVAAHPEDLSGWKERAGFEQLAKHEDEYLESLENVARLESNEANLKALSDYQNYKQKYAEQKETLVQLVAMTNKQNADYLVALADVAMLAEDKETALSAYDGYFKNETFAANLDHAKIEPYIRLLAQADRKDEAVDQAIVLTKDAKIAVVIQQQNNEIVLAQNESMNEGSASGNMAPPPPPMLGGMPANEDEAAAGVPVPPPAPPAEPMDSNTTQAPAASVESIPVPPPAPPAEPMDSNTTQAPAASVESIPVPPPAPPAEPMDSNTTQAPAVPEVPTEMVADVELQARIADVLLFEAGADYAVRYIEAVSANSLEGEISEALQPVYARAMVQQGKYAKALPILKALSVKGGEYREWYFLALSSAAKKDKDARVELVSFVQDDFARGDLTEDQKIDRVYALLNAGEKALALDYTERALQSTSDATARDKWQSLYKGLTAKPKAARSSSVRAVPRVSLEQKLQIANRPGASQDYVRRTAFEALAAGRKGEAVALFARLAAANGPKSSDAEQLSYLWGARLAGEELSWVIDIANQSSGEERFGWMSKVASSAASEDIVAIAEAYPDWLQHPEFERRYVNSLVQLGDTQALSQYLSSEASSSQSVEAYQMVASQAGSVMDMKTQEQALRQAAAIAPQNREIWLQLTSMYLSRARYTAAGQTLANAMNVDGMQYATDPYTAARQSLAMNYYAGALSKRDGEYTLASDYFARAVSMPENQAFTDRDSQVKLLSAQMALGNETAASQGFEVLLENSPGDATLLADYMGALLDRGSYMQALDVAGRHGGDVVLDSGVAVEDPEPVIVQAVNGEMPLIQSMSGGSELKLQYPRPLPANYQVLSNVQNPSWVSYTSTSYDTALIVAQSGYSLQANATPEGLMVSAVPSSNASSVEAIRQRYLRLQLLYARLELETGATDKALERLESLAPTYQEYPEYRAYQANAEYYAGNLKRGLDLIKRAQVGDQGNEDIAYLRRNIERFHAEHLKLDHEWQKLGDHRMHITTLEGRKQFDNSIEVSAQIQNNFLDTDFVQRASGAVQKVDGQRWRATLSLAKFMDDSSIIEGSIYANKNTAGAGISYQFVNPIGTTQVYAQYHKPYWDVIEAVVEDATRDRIAAWHLWRSDPRWSVRVDAGYNRYNVDRKSSLADAIGVQATILRTIWDKNPYIALAYGYDGEYFLGKIGRNGATQTKLLPLRAREVHSLSSIFYQDFTRDTNGELNIGYAIDRLGDHGPAIEARLTHYLTEEVDIQLRSRYGLDAQETSNDALSVGGYVRWTW